MWTSGFFDSRFGVDLDVEDVCAVYSVRRSVFILRLCPQWWPAVLLEKEDKLLSEVERWLVELEDEREEYSEGMAAVLCDEKLTTSIDSSEIDVVVSKHGSGVFYKGLLGIKQESRRRDCLYGYN